jgi:acyl-coenzyme A synthetase/AMP-(fatty) acid ligase
MVVAFIAFAPSQNVDHEIAESMVREMTDELQENLHQSVPSVMHPSHYLAIKEIPMIATGKIERKQLRVSGEMQICERL